MLLAQIQATLKERGSTSVAGSPFGETSRNDNDIEDDTGVLLSVRLSEMCFVEVVF